jgi:hypothetical protein
MTATKRGGPATNNGTATGTTATEVRDQDSRLQELAQAPKKAREGTWWAEEPITILDQALAEAGRGRVPVPACASPCTVPWHDQPCAGKRPLVKIKDRDQVPTEAQIRRWWRRWPEAQLAILTGARSGLVVIDIDGPEGEANLEKVEQVLVTLPYTLEVRTKHGRHLYFRHPGNGIKILTRKGTQFTTWNDIPEPAPGLDVRGDGGLVIAPPSRDREYANELEPVELPAAWVEPLSTSATPTAGLGDQELAEALDKIRTDGEPCSCMERVLAKHQAAEGGRHGAMLTAQTALAHLGREQHPGAGQALDKLLDAFLAGKPDGEHEWSRALDGAVAAAMATEPEATGCPYVIKNHHLGEQEPDLDELMKQHAARSEEKAREREKEATPKSNKEKAIEQEMVRIIARREAERRIAAMVAGTLPDPVLTPLAELLAEPDDDPAYRIAGLWPTGGNIILAAQRKAGKTTLVGNLARSLVDGDAFLGRGDALVTVGGYDVEPVDGMVALLDFELDRRMLRRWLADQNIGKRDQVMAESMRGKAALFDVLDDDRRGRWAEYLAQHGVKVLILDPLGALLDAYGRDENSNSDVGPVLAALDALKDAAGVEELFLAHHMGHGPERSRGASKLRGWPDAEWFLVRERAKNGEEPPPDAARFFLAEGRDVMVPETRLEYEPRTRALTVAGGNRVQHQATKHGPAVLGLIELTPGMSGREMVDAAQVQGIGRDAARAALKVLVRDGLVRTETGPKRATLHYPAQEPEQAQAQGKKPDPFADQVKPS